MRLPLALLLVIGLVSALAAGPTLAAAPRTTLNAVEAQLMCDTCRVPLSVAESARADQERAEVRTLIARGMTRQQILDFMAHEWGNDILAVPKGGGSSITVWAIPAAVVAAVALGLLLTIPRWRRRQPGDDPGASDGPELSGDEAQRLDREIAAYDL